MPFLALINPRVWFELALFAFLGLFCWWGYNMIYDRGAASIQTKWDIEKLQVAQQTARIQANALEITKNLTSSMESQRSQTNEQLDSLNNHLADALNGLRNRPDRPSKSNMPSNTADTKSATGCTGAGLYRPDGEFLSRYANDTARLQLELKACYTNYDTAREAVK